VQLWEGDIKRLTTSMFGFSVTADPLDPSAVESTSHLPELDALFAQMAAAMVTVQGWIDDPEPLRGPQGESTTIAVGTTTTLAADQPAAVTARGTAQALTLDFAIPRGEAGVGLAILGHYETLGALQTTHPVGNPGDMYSVGATMPYRLYVWNKLTSAWFDEGQLSGGEGTVTAWNGVSPDAEGNISADAGNLPYNLSDTTVVSTRYAIAALAVEVEAINAEKGAPGGVATLNAGGTVPSAQLPVTTPQSIGALPAAHPVAVTRAAQSGSVVTLDGTIGGVTLGVSANGTATQDGTPAPDAPVEITGVDSLNVTSIGNNFLNLQQVTNPVANNVTVNVDTNSITLTTTGNATPQQWYGRLAIPAALRGRTLRISVGQWAATDGTADPRIVVQQYAADDSELSSHALDVKQTSAVSFVVNAEATYVILLFCCDQAAPYSPAGSVARFADVMLSLNPDDTGYTPYHGASHAISIDPPLYGLPGAEDKIDVTGGVVTRRTRRRALDGTEPWSTQAGNVASGYFYRCQLADAPLYGAGVKASAAMCTHLAWKTTGISTLNSGDFYIGTNGTNSATNFLAVFSQATVADLKAWLAAQATAGTPVEIVYELAVPTIASVTPTPIPACPKTTTVYADLPDIDVEYRADITSVIANLQAQITLLQGQTTIGG
jgi:hypothetical protein